MNQQISLDILRNAEARFLQVQAFQLEQVSMYENEFFFFFTVSNKNELISFIWGFQKRDVYCVNKILIMKCFQDIKYRNN